MRGSRAGVLAATSAVIFAFWPSAAAAEPQNGDVAYTADDAASDGYAIARFAAELGEVLDPTPKPLADSNGDDFGPAYDPTGEWIAFTSDRTGNHEIFTMRADGSQQTQVTNDPGSDQYPSWFGIAGFAYMSQDPVGGDTEISVINADGTNPVQLTNNSQNDLTPAVSPDGSLIAYARQSQGIRVMNADGSNDVQVPNTSALALAPRWLGNQLVFTEGVGMNNQIFRMNLDGSGKTPLTSGSQDVLPVPSPNGEYVMFQRDVGGEFKLFGMTADGESEGPFEGLDVTVEPAGMDQQPREAPVVDAGLERLRKTKLRAEAEASENARLFVQAFVVFGGGGFRQPVVPRRAKRKAKFKPATVAVEANTPTRVSMKPSRKAKKVIARAADERRKVKVTLTATATDDVGDSSEVTVKKRLKPKP